MKNKRLLRWGYVLALVTLIYSTLAIVRPVCDFLRNHTPFSLLLAYLIYRALRLDLKNGRLYLTTIILSGIVGWGDEGIQHLLPNRYYDLRDVTFNFLGAVLGCFLLFVWDKSKRILNH